MIAAAGPLAGKAHERGRPCLDVAKEYVGNRAVRVEGGQIAGVTGKGHVPAVGTQDRVEGIAVPQVAGRRAADKADAAAGPEVANEDIVVPTLERHMRPVGTDLGDARIVGTPLAPVAPVLANTMFPCWSRTKRS